MPTPFSSIAVYEFNKGHIACSAFDIKESSSCERWLKDDVAKRVYDEPLKQEFQETVNGIASEGFNIDILQQYANLPDSQATEGDIGEGIADLFLTERQNYHLPPHRRRDLRTPKGSLPGADIAGYVEELGVELFVFGEVKASGQDIAPPSVMTHTNEGMPAQLIRLATRIDIRRQLLFYLQTRAKGTPLWDRHTAAMTSLASGKYKLVGVLVRSTAPRNADVDGPASKLQSGIPDSQACSLYVLHTGLDTADWLVHCQPT